MNNLCATCKLFDLNTKTLGRWIASETRLKDSKRGVRWGRYTDMEARLHDEYKELRAKGLKVGQLMDEMHLYLRGGFKLLRKGIKSPIHR